MKKRILSLVLVTALAISSMAAFTGCKGGETKTEPGTDKTTSKPAEKKDVALTVWGSQDDQKMLNEMIESFKTSNTDNNYNITVKVTGEDKAKDEVLKDLDAAADVFAFGHDQLGALVNAGAVYENTLHVDDIKANDVEAALTAASFNGKVYGYPSSAETYFLYYDKSKLSAEDVKTFEGIMAKKTAGVTPFAAQMDNAYFTAAFFLTAGCELFGKTGTDDNTVTFNTAGGVSIGNLIASMKKDGVGSFKQEDATSQFKAGKLASMIMGPWMASAYKEVLGDNYGVAPLPTIKVDGKDMPMTSFAGYKVYAVKSNTKFPEEAMALANYLTSKEMQLKRFEDRGFLPVNKDLAKDEKVISDVTVKATLEQLANAIPMPSSPKMGNFWSVFGGLTNDLYNNKLGGKTMQAKLDDIVAQIKK